MTLVRGSFQHLIYSPRGAIEGVLLSQDDAPVQIVFDKHDEDAPTGFVRLHDGQHVVVEAEPSPPSSKGGGDHAVHDFVRLVSIDGRKPSKTAAVTTGYAGTVVRLNYARHGAPNGVVLDTGDFIHTKPDGMAALKLKVGDRITADGDAQWLSTDTGWAVEADRVNGKPVAGR